MIMKKTIKDAVARIGRDFSNKAYVTTVLDEICKEDELGGLRGRFYVGEKGKVGFYLFPDTYRGEWVGYPVQVVIGIPGKNRAETLEKMDAYVGAIREYLTTAETHARAHGFELVLGEKRSVEEIIDLSFPSSYHAGIGTVDSIGSAKKLVEFITMVKTGYETLDEKLSMVIEKAKPLPHTEEWRTVRW